MKGVIKISVLVLFALFSISGYIYNQHPGTMLEAAKVASRVNAGLERNEVRVDDHTWVYLDGGKGEAILFLHGFGADKDLWGNFITMVSGSYRVILPDLPGFGESTRTGSCCYGVKKQAERLERFVTRIGLEKFHIFGSSMGGGIGAWYAATHPERVLSLALVDTMGVAWDRDSYSIKRLKQDRVNLFLYDDAEEYDEFMSAIFYMPPDTPLHLKRFIAMQNGKRKDFLDRTFRVLYEQRNVLAQCMPKIRNRTLVIWGANDQVFDASCAKNAGRSVPGCCVNVIDNCGHLPYLEKPEETGNIYRKFLGSL